ncbi:MAG: heparin lyase I family protein [Nannocystales bacterium]
MRTRGLALALTSGLLLAPSVVEAAPVWSGDFESADLSQFGFLLNPTINRVDYITLEEGQVAQGSYAARVELHNDAQWGNGLKRVELQHRPEDARTAEGSTTFFAWSLYVPYGLPADPSQQIGYWESAGSYQQVMAFEAVGSTLRFHTRRPQNVTPWEADVLTVGEWHRIAMSVTWSTSVDQGRVSLWFDGEQVVADASAQTLADNNPHFVQVGLLRGAIEFEDVPTIILDHALEGDSLEDVEFDTLPDASGESTGGGSSGGGWTTGETSDASDSGDSDSTTGGTPSSSSDGPGGSTSNSGDSATAGTPTTTADGGTGTDTDSAAASGEGGCSTGERPKSAAMLVFLGVLGLIRRRGA